MTELGQRIEGGEGVVILDGATGTELGRRGVPMDEVAWWSGARYAPRDHERGARGLRQGRCRRDHHEYLPDLKTRPGTCWPRGPLPRVDHARRGAGETVQRERGKARSLHSRLYLHCPTRHINALQPPKVRVRTN